MVVTKEVRQKLVCCVKYQHQKSLMQLGIEWSVKDCYIVKNCCFHFCDSMSRSMTVVYTTTYGTVLVIHSELVNAGRFTQPLDIYFYGMYLTFSFGSSHNLHCTGTGTALLICMLWGGAAVVVRSCIEPVSAATVFLRLLCFNIAPGFCIQIYFNRVEGGTQMKKKNTIEVPLF